MRGLSRKLLVSISTLSFALIALGTATFAWFTLTNTATVSQFSATVTSSDGIEVSLGAANPNFYTNVPISDVDAFLNGAGFHSEFRMQHITSKDGKNFKDLAGNTKTAPATDGYISFQLRFRSLTASMPIYMATGSGLSGAYVSWVADADFINGQGTAITGGGDAQNYYVANAARLSVGTTGGTPLVYELPDGAYGEVTDASYGNSVLGTSAKLNGGVYYYNQKNGLISYPGEGETYNGLLYEAATPVATTTTFVNQNAIATLSGTAGEGGYYYATITVNVWIEGWDADCFDSLYRALLKIDLQFTTVKPV